MSLQGWPWRWQGTKLATSFLELRSTSAWTTPASSRSSSTPPTCTTSSPTTLSSSNRPPSSERSGRYDHHFVTVLSPWSLHRLSVSDRQRLQVRGRLPDFQNGLPETRSPHEPVQVWLPAQRPPAPGESAQVCKVSSVRKSFNVKVTTSCGAADAPVSLCGLAGSLGELCWGGLIMQILSASSSLPTCNSSPACEIRSVHNKLHLYETFTRVFFHVHCSWGHLLARRTNCRSSFTFSASTFN